MLAGDFLKLKNVLTHISKTPLPYEKIGESKEKMMAYAAEHQAAQVGEFIVLVHDANVHTGVMQNYEIILPIDKRVPNFGRPSYIFHENYILQGCIMSKYQGHFLQPHLHYKVLEREALLYLQELEKSKAKREQKE